MDYKDRDKIDYLCDHLIQNIDINKLWPKLLENRVYNRDDVNIPNWQKNLSSPENVYNICSTIKTRGPHAFNNFILSLTQSGHQRIADGLKSHGTPNSTNNSNNNVTSVNSSNIPAEPRYERTSRNSNYDELSKEDDYHTKLSIEDKPLKIKVIKATEFKDGPEIKDIERYPMRSTPRGLVLIITNIDYKMVKSRGSAEHDEVNLKQLFEEMGFKVIIHRNLTGKEIKKTVYEFSKLRELRRVDSAFIIISSHGTGEHGKQETEIQGTDYQFADYEQVFCTDIIDYFTVEQCPNLDGKPKIFIFQTCRNKNDKNTQRQWRVVENSFKSNNLSDFSSNSARGDVHQKAVSRCVTDTVVTEFTETEKPYKLSSRNYADTLIAYATLPGYVSYRDSLNGSWFIQILCEVFMNYAYERHVQDLFTMTDGRLKDLRTASNQCQTLWVINQGFHKHCYINPGLFPKPVRDIAK